MNPAPAEIESDMIDPDESNQTDIERLLAEAKQGNADALGQLLSKYRRYLIFLARSGLHQHVRGKADPSDIAQEVCLAAHESLQHFRGESAEQFASWLRGILTNTLAMHVRRYIGTDKRNAKLEEKLNHSLTSASNFLQSQLAADVTSPSQHFARNEAFLQLASALETLPDDYRQVIVLRHVEGLPFAKVAQLMNRSVPSVEKLWVRALAKLKLSVKME